ncbi:MAG TPA: tyrosine-protein phosphatase [Acidimicrobiales bacterium]|nr:tyrosine-protein phosphatase [Acidimicrobiales bacterium]
MRWVPLEGGGNFRDVGGYPTTDGRRTRFGVLYRSGALDALTGSGVDDFRRLGIRSIVDLRTAEERAPLPWIDDAAVEVTWLPSSNPAAASIAFGSYDPGSLYIAAIEDRARQIPTVLDLVADPRRLPVVVTCSGGKDRTGMVIALLLGILGVPDDTIVEDYALSDEFMTRDATGFSAALERVTAAGLDPEVLRTRPDTMWRFLREISARSGSIRAFALELGVPAEVVEQARTNLLEASDGR